VIPVRILGTASVFPGRKITTAEVCARAVPPRDAAVIEAKTGIQTRYFADPGTQVTDIAAEALRAAAKAASIDVRSLRRVILCNSQGGDFIAPATVNSIIHALDLDNRCDGFDVSNACMGFLSSFDAAVRAVATGLYPIGVVAAEIMTRIMRPEDTRPWVVFGDAASAVILGPGRPGEGVRGISLCNDGSLGNTVVVTQPVVTRQPGYVQMMIPSTEISRIVIKVLRDSARAVLEPCGQTIDDVDWVLPHQPNGNMLNVISEALGVDPAKIVPVVQEVGSIVSASIPVSLDRLMRTRPVKPGDQILMIGVGTGVAYGAALYRVAP
jgi:3-oxoacyl-(acyl-carrier-protein) synthase III